MSARRTRDLNSLPSFTTDGVLPVGDYPLTLDALRSSLLVLGPDDIDRYPNWDASWRLYLVNNLTTMVEQLWKVGISEIYIDGSFVEDKEHPNDIDGYFECELKHWASGRLEQELNLLDPHKIWTWDPTSRRRARGFAKRQLPMWQKYRVELFPHVGQTTGIRDVHGNELDFPSAFRLARGGIPKGIVKLIKSAGKT